MSNNIVAAVAAAWPGDNALARFRRRVAMELASFDSGPVGPHSVLAARLSSHLRERCPTLVTEAAGLCTPRDGSLRIKQLISLAPDVPSNGVSAGEDVPGGAFLYCVSYKYDACVFLDVQALLKWHAGGKLPATSNGGNGGGAGTFKAEFGSGSVRTGFSSKQGGIHINLSGLVPRYGKPGADSASPYSRPSGMQSEDDEDGDFEDDEGADVMTSGADGEAVEGEDEGAVHHRPPPLQHVAYMAFPGPSAASQLRRNLAVLLATAAPDGGGGLPPYAIPWRQIALMVADSKAAALQPVLRTPAAFKSFILHPASAGAFAAKRFFRNPADPNSSVDCVELDPAALRRAAAEGINKVIFTAWRGPESLLRLKRTAVKILLERPRTPDGPYAMNAGPLGNELRARNAPAYTAVMSRGGGGLMAQLDESGRGREALLVYVRKGGKEGTMQLKLRKLCCLFPPDTGLDLGLGLGGAGALPPPAAPLPSNSGGTASAASATQLPSSQTSLLHAAPSGATAPSQAGMATEGSSSSGGGAYGAAAANSIPSDPWVTNDAAPTEGPAFNWNDVSSATAVVLEAEPRGLTAFPPGIPGSVSAGVAASSLGVAANVVGATAATPASIANAVEAAVLPAPAVQWIQSSFEFETMIQHCYGATQIGLAIHATGRRAVVAAIYAPAATATIDVRAATGQPSSGGAQLLTWVATVYLFDCGLVTAAQEGGSDGAVVGAGGALPGAAAALCGLLESAYVAKFVHGCEQVMSLAALCGAASISPLLDTRVLLRALSALLPPLPALPPPPPPYAAIGPLAAAAVAGLNAHVAALREVLTATGLWADRPELLAALTGRHSVALREDLFGTRDWASNASLHECNLVAAVRHLPELWEAMTTEAVPWVAMAAAATASAAALASRQGAGAASHAHVGPVAS
ncbi:hypothetical protein Agub_g12790 [Astrephomene gubernaculifera]|uniref:Uncharacterized protein n=1 Tax=Astrephomene gubernaculifera TaxID=47775 RepID=A0AAD3E361_9CHLO|nr:hypothetical protein Agub_g12790 [Astrephomene gubernaculifera]